MWTNFPLQFDIMYIIGTLDRGEKTTTISTYTVFHLVHIMIKPQDTKESPPLHTALPRPKK